jgi:hypothetical protein
LSNCSKQQATHAEELASSDFASEVGGSAKIHGMPLAIRLNTEALYTVHCTQKTTSEITKRTRNILTISNHIQQLQPNVYCILGM